MVIFLNSINYNQKNYIKKLGKPSSTFSFVMIYNKNRIKSK